MVDKKDKDNLIASGASLSPKRPPVDIKDEAAVIAEFRRLKKKIDRLHNELHLAHYSIKVFKKLFFEAPEYEEVRKLVLSFADEYAIVHCSQINRHENERKDSKYNIVESKGMRLFCKQNKRASSLFCLQNNFFLRRSGKRHYCANEDCKSCNNSQCS